MSNLQRKLTIILVADVVGFSKMMGRDEVLTLATLKSCRDIIDDAIDRHHGRIFGSAGDNLIAEFSSPVEAVICATEFQDWIAKRNETQDENSRMRFRVGINMGDVIIDGDNLFGDGVNVAARLESIAAAGGVCVSNKVYDEVRRKLDLVFSAGGEQQLKNIEDPVTVYHLGSSGDAIPQQSTRAAKHDHPLVFVPPIKAAGSGDDIGSLAEGLREVIISGLAAQTALQVTREDQEADADFILQGNVRGAGKKVRANFTLRDQDKGSEVWAERFDRELADLFDLEDEISASVVSAVRVRLKALEMELLESADNDTLTLPQLLSKAAGYFVRSPGDNEQALEILNLVLKKKPDHPMALAMAAFCLWRKNEFSPLAVDEHDKRQMQTHIRRALELDQSSYFALLIAAMLEIDFNNDFRAALDHVEQALELNPEFTMAQATAGIAKCYLNDRQAGLDDLSHAMAANREDPHRFRHQRELALILAMENRFGEASDVMRRLVHQAPDLCRNGLISAAIYWQAGEEENARHCLAELLRRFPKLNSSNMRQVHFKNRDQEARYLSALHNAGLPDG